MSNLSLNLNDLRTAADFVMKSDRVWITPMIYVAEHSLKSLAANDSSFSHCSVYLKLESAQNSGSFKIRGVYNQLANLPHSADNIFTISGGNYGMAFANLVNQCPRVASSTVLVPKSAPNYKAAVMEAFGSTVHRPLSSQLLNEVDRLKQRGLTFVNPIDDLHLIYGYSSLGFEILNQMSSSLPDIILVPCGGGGLLAAICAAIRLSITKSSEKTAIYGVEPETADTMRRSFVQNRPIVMPEAHSVASGLTPPYAGQLTFALCQQYNCNGILTVSDREIIESMKSIYEILGIMLEPSGAAALAALLYNRVPMELEKKKVVVVLSGKNIDAESFREMVSFGKVEN